MTDFDSYLTYLSESRDLEMPETDGEAGYAAAAWVLAALDDAVRQSVETKGTVTAVPSAAEIARWDSDRVIPAVLDSWCATAPTTLGMLGVFAYVEAFRRAGPRSPLTGNEARWGAGVCVGAALALWHTDPRAALGMLRQADDGDDGSDEEPIRVVRPACGWLDTKPDLGPAAIAAVVSLLVGDEQYLVLPIDRGVLWSAGRLPVTIRAGVAQVGDDGDMWVRVTLCAVVLTGSGLSRRETAALLTRLNTDPMGGAFVRSTRTGNIEYTVAASLAAQDLVEQAAELVFYARLGLDTAELLAGPIRDHVGTGTVPEWSHPVHGVRETPSAVIGAGARETAEHGQAACQLQATQELEEIGTLFSEAPFYSLGGDSLNVCFEVACGHGNTSLVQAQSELVHSTLGSGLFITTTIALGGTVEECDMYAGQLHDAEEAAEPARGMFGAWVPVERPAGMYVAYRQFIPNSVCSPGAVTLAISDSARRAVWIHDLFNPEMPLPDARPIYEERVRRRAAESMPN